MQKTEIRKSTNKDKKYDVFQKNKKLFSFGARGYEHFKDTTPLRLYTSKDHGQTSRRKNYIKRHTGADTKQQGLKIIEQKYGRMSPGYFSLKYLW